ncbi:MAG TPA: BlaI/MecI/CopY family transcriptional regulator [Fimbriimonas sp.]|nr:BlaI/MecI/CopY family transcriptional regulator [Fimbriimonas sp.]
MSKKDKRNELSRRERQIVDAIYQLGTASAAEIRDAMTDPPTYTAVRTLLGILEQKGHVRHQNVGNRYFYSPTVPRDEMGKSAIHNVLQTFFGGSVERVVATLLDGEETNLSDEQLDRLATMIEQARKEGR